MKNLKEVNKILDIILRVNLIAIGLVIIGNLAVTFVQLIVGLIDSLFSLIAFNGSPFVNFSILTYGLTAIDLDFGTAILASAVIYLALKLNPIPSK